MKYLAVLSVLFFVGCASGGNTGGETSARGNYRDYTYSKDGTVMVHRVYTNGHQEWLNQAAAMESSAT